MYLYIDIILILIILIIRLSWPKPTMVASSRPHVYLPEDSPPPKHTYSRWLGVDARSIIPVRARPQSCTKAIRTGQAPIGAASALEIVARA